MSNIKNPSEDFQLNLGTQSPPISSASATFAERSRDVFAGLNELEKFKPGSSLHQETAAASEQPNQKHSIGRGQKDTEHFRCRESIFKLSEREESGWPPPPSSGSKIDRYNKPAVGNRWERGRDQDSDFSARSSSYQPRQGFKRPFYRPQKGSVPDHVKNPGKYTKYSLEDAPGVTDRSNAQAAFAFLNQLKEANEHHSDEKSGKDKNNKMVFKKPKIRREKEENMTEKLNVETHVFTPGPSKRILPEAVVGRSAKSTKKSKLQVKLADDWEDEQMSVSCHKSEHKTDAKDKRPNKNCKTRLSHLMFEEEDD